MDLYTCFQELACAVIGQAMRDIGTWYYTQRLRGRKKEDIDIFTEDLPLDAAQSLTFFTSPERLGVYTTASGNGFIRGGIFMGEQRYQRTRLREYLKTVRNEDCFEFHGLHFTNTEAPEKGAIKKAGFVVDDCDTFCTLIGEDRRANQIEVAKIPIRRPDNGQRNEETAYMDSPDDTEGLLEESDQDY